MKVDQQPRFRIISQLTERKPLGNFFNARLLLYKAVQLSGIYAQWCNEPREEPVTVFGANAERNDLVFCGA